MAKRCSSSTTMVSCRRGVDRTGLADCELSTRQTPPASSYAVAHAESRAPPVAPFSSCCTTHASPCIPGAHCAQRPQRLRRPAAVDAALATVAPELGQLVTGGGGGTHSCDAVAMQRVTRPGHVQQALLESLMRRVRRGACWQPQRHWHTDAAYRQGASARPTAGCRVLSPEVAARATAARQLLHGNTRESILHLQLFATLLTFLQVPLRRSSGSQVAVTRHTAAFSPVSRRGSSASGFTSAGSCTSLCPFNAARFPNHHGGPPVAHHYDST